jgi:hypothetical protein
VLGTYAMTMRHNGRKVACDWVHVDAQPREDHEVPRVDRIRRKSEAYRG